MYDLPEYNYKDLKNGISKAAHNKMVQALGLLLIILVAIEFISGSCGVILS